MPVNIVRTPHEEKMWRQAKEAAAREGHAGDYAYITGTYERIRARVGGKKGKGAYREHMREGKHGRLVLKAQLREQGVAMNPQDRDEMADVLMRENGVVEPETEEPQGTTDRPQPGMIRRYDKHGRRTRAVINPQAHERPMVYSRRGERSPDAQAELRRRGTEVPSGGVSGQKVYDYLRPNYPRETLGWVTGQDWHFSPKVQLADVHMERRPGGRDMAKVESMAEAARQGKRFEPIVLCADKNGLYVADGYHRLLAYRKAGLKTIAAYVADGGPTNVLPAMHRRKINKSLGDPPTVLRAPERYKGDIDLFLAGSCTERRWRHEVEQEIVRAGVHAIIADPERDDFPDEGTAEYSEQVQWEREHLGRARVVAFWLDAEKPTSYASRVELGSAVARGQKIVLGMSADFPGRPYIETYAGVRAHTDLMDFTGAIIAALEKPQGWREQYSRHRRARAEILRQAAEPVRKSLALPVAHLAKGRGFGHAWSDDIVLDAVEHYRELLARVHPQVAIRKLRDGFAYEDDAGKHRASYPWLRDYLRTDRNADDTLMAEAFVLCLVRENLPVPDVDIAGHNAIKMAELARASVERMGEELKDAGPTRVHPEGRGHPEPVLRKSIDITVQAGAPLQKIQRVLQGAGFHAATDDESPGGLWVGTHNDRVFVMPERGGKILVQSFAGRSQKALRVQKKIARTLAEAFGARAIYTNPTLDGPPVVLKSARNTDGRYIRPKGAAHRRRKGWNPNPRVALRRRPHPSAMPGEAGHTLASPMAESSMQVMHAITASKRRDPREGDWGFDPLKNLPGNTAEPKPIGKPSIFVYKSDPQIQQAVSDYGALIEHGKSPSAAIQTIAQRFPWVLEYDTPRGKDWWAAVRRANLPYPPAFDLEIDPDANARMRPKQAVFWREDLANLGQGIGAPTGSGGAGR